MNLVIIGPQGSGKGTQAEFLVNELGLRHIETGEILRKIAETNTVTGRLVRETMDRGELVSDEVLMEILKDQLDHTGVKGFLFDGTPRNLVQYKLINDILALHGQKIDKVILLNLPEEETIKRLSSRRTCEQCGRVYNLITNPSPNGESCECGGELIQREDDVPEAIKRRLLAFWRSTEQVIEAFKQENILVEVDGNQPIETIHQEIRQKLEI